MSDKEPRRRKKRKDLQAARKEEIFSDDQVFGKMETKDCDQDATEDIAPPSYQPSVFAKFVFVLLFSGLIVSMSFIFISLQGTQTGDIDIFDDHHAEELEMIHDIHHDGEKHDGEDHNGEEHDVHHDDEEHGIDHEEEITWTLSKASLKENIEAYLPGIGNILSFTDEPSKEPEDMLEDLEISKDHSEGEKLVDEESESTSIETTEENETPDLDEEDDDTIFAQEQTQAPPDVSYQQQEPNPEVPEPVPSDIPPELELDEDDFEMTPQSTIDYVETTPQSTIEESDYTTYSPNAFLDDDNDEEYVSPMPGKDDQSQTESSFEPDSNFIDDAAGDKEEELSFYGKSDITNEEDYLIREQLDELEEALEKEFVAEIDSDDDDSDDDEDDDYDETDGIGDEFDFWQF